MIEAPVSLRCRQFEIAAYRRLLNDYMQAGGRWVSAPRPLLEDALYVGADGRPGLANLEPVFDAANVLRLGNDLLYLLSSSGNLRGAQWLQQALGPEYRVHACGDLYASTHIDSTVMPLDWGLVLVNPSRVSDSNMPDMLRGWDKIWAPEMVDTGFVGRYPFSSTWVGMNVLPLGPRRVIVEASQAPLIRALSYHGVECVGMPLRHSRTLGGGFHCATLDIRRQRG
jgi:glycine amidinotransferase/scyllo-inosamine-4-phosphate amidinotransferase 1